MMEKKEDSKRHYYITLASWISIGGNFLLGASKLVAGFYSGSTAVIGDGLDSMSDVLISFITLIASKIMMKPPDKEHPYGYHRVETLATTILSFIIFALGVQMLLSTCRELWAFEIAEVPGNLAMWVSAFSIAGKLFLAWTQFFLGKKVGSNMLIANGHNMFNDVISSAGVLFGLVIGYFLNIGLIDKLIALVLSFVILKSAINISKPLITELMDGQDFTGNVDLYRNIFRACREVAPGQVHPHRARVRTVGSVVAIELDILVDGSMTVNDSHLICISIEKNIREKLDNVLDITIHVEPAGEEHHIAEGRFGITRSLLGESPLHTTIDGLGEIHTSAFVPDRRIKSD